MTDTTARPTALSYDLPHPQGFTRDTIGWVPWLEPLPREDFTERHWDGVINPPRADFDYFRLLVRDPEVLRARTLMDRDIFTKESDGGLPRAERELAATAVSRTNGCVYCASVHARTSSNFSKRPQDLDRLLAEGTSADLGERWNAIVAASEALAQSPIAFDVEDITALREGGLEDIAIVDMIQSAAYFNWANRLMLSVGRAVEL
ncbi:alkylhydroperoxidase domain protein [Microbacterium sp. A588]